MKRELRQLLVFLRKWSIIGSLLVIGFGGIAGRFAEDPRFLFVYASALCAAVLLTAYRLRAKAVIKYPAAIALSVTILLVCSFLVERLHDEEAFSARFITVVRDEREYPLWVLVSGQPTRWSPINLFAYAEITNMRKSPVMIRSLQVETEVGTGQWVELPSINPHFGRLIESSNPKQARVVALETPTMISELNGKNIQGLFTVKGLLFFEKPKEGWGKKYRVTIVESNGGISTHAITQPDSIKRVGAELDNLSFYLHEPNVDLTIIPRKLYTEVFPP